MNHGSEASDTQRLGRRPLRYRRAERRPVIEMLEDRTLMASIQFLNGGATFKVSLATPDSTLTPVQAASINVPDTNSTGDSGTLTSSPDTFHDFPVYTYIRLNGSTFDVKQPIHTLSFFYGGFYTESPYDENPFPSTATAILAGGTAEIMPDAGDRVGDPVDVMVGGFALINDVISGGQHSGGSFTGAVAVQGNQGQSFTFNPNQGQPNDTYARQTAVLHFHVGDRFTVTFNGAGTSPGTLADFTAEMDADIQVIARAQIAPTTPSWNSSDGGVDYGYTISGADLPQTTNVALYWGPTTTFDSSQDTLIPASIVESQTTVGVYGSFHLTPAQAGTPAQGEKYLLAVADPNNMLGTFSQSSNVKSIPIQNTDLAVSIDPSNVVPVTAQGPYIAYGDLHLLSVYGGENVQVPVTIINKGQADAKGHGSFSLYLSPTPDVSPQAVLLTPLYATNGTIHGQSVDESIDLQGSESLRDTIYVQIPASSSLQAGKDHRYYVLAKLDDPSINESDASSGEDKNNVARSNTTFEYLGTPTYTPVFAGGTYFKFILDTLNAASGEAPWAVQTKDPTITNLADGMAFIKAFEGDKRYSYMDPSNIPTIGVGINLTTIDKKFRRGSQDPLFTLQQNLAEDVIKYYKTLKSRADRQEYRKIKLDTGVNSYKVVKLLEQQASANANKIVLTIQDDQNLFQESYDLRAKNAQDILGTVWSNLKKDPREQITPIDQLYNSKGGIFPGMVDDLAENDFVLAGFDVVDSKNVNDSLTNPKLRGLQLRMEAEYQNLLAAHIADLVSP
jgi:GH24 family phage-related lysozyme (muramidase)